MFNFIIEFPGPTSKGFSVGLGQGYFTKSMLSQGAWPSGRSDFCIKVPN